MGRGGAGIGDYVPGKVGERFEAGVMDGTLSSREDYDKLIEPYDDHPGVRGGGP